MKGSTDLVSGSGNDGGFSKSRKVLLNGVPATVVYEEHWDSKTLWYVYLDGEDEMRKFYSPPAEVMDIEE